MQDPEQDQDPASTSLGSAGVGHVGEPLWLEHFLLERELGRGGMGTVYLARNTMLGRREAVKVLRLDDAAVDREAALRFEREGRLAAEATRHGPHALATIYAAGRTDDVVWLSMEYVEGRSLDRAIAERRSPPGLDRVLTILYPVAEALDALHRTAGIVHRDVKPANIVVRPDGRAVLVDFGIAYAVGSDDRLTGTGYLIGSRLYIAPEAYRSRDAVGPAADQFGLAAVVYEALTGRPARDEAAGGLRLIPLRSVDPSLGSEVDAVLERALDRDPAARWGSCTEFLDELEGAGRAHPSGIGRRGGGTTISDGRGRPAELGEPRRKTTPIVRRTPARRGRRRPRAWKVAVASIVVGAVAVASIAGWSMTRPWSGDSAELASMVPGMVGANPRGGGFGGTDCAPSTAALGATSAISCTGTVPFTVYGYHDRMARDGALTSYVGGTASTSIHADGGCTVATTVLPVRSADLHTVVVAPDSTPVFAIVDIPDATSAPDSWVRAAPLC